MLKNCRYSSEDQNRHCFLTDLLDQQQGKLEDFLDTNVGTEYLDMERALSIHIRGTTF
jgi:hypothetical protein